MKVCQAFTQVGHDVTLLVPENQQSAISHQQLQSHYGLHTLFDIEWLSAGSRRLFPWKAVRRARRLDPDLLYAWPIQAAALGLLAGMPAMLEMHDYPSGHFGPGWYRLFLRLRGRKRLLPITDALRCALEQKYDAPRNGDVIVAPDGVDIESYRNLPDPQSARRQLDLPPTPTVLCTGHLYPGRGTDLFLELAKRFPDVRFVWVGGKPAEATLWGYRAFTMGLRNVTFTGFVPNELIPLHQAAADVLLMPYGRIISTSSGGNTAEICSPMKMFEYMAAGRAVLTSNLPVLREVLDDSTALFCPVDDAEAWEFALGGLLADEKRRQALGQRARSVVEKYSWIERTKRVLEGFK